MEQEEEFYTLPRARIMRALKDYPNSTQKDLEEITGLSRGTLKHHLITLEKSKLIITTKPEKKLKGNPVFINITPKAQPPQLKTIETLEKLYTALGFKNKERKLK